MVQPTTEQCGLILICDAQLFLKGCNGRREACDLNVMAGHSHCRSSIVPPHTPCTLKCFVNNAVELKMFTLEIRLASGVATKRIRGPSIRRCATKDTIILASCSTIPGAKETRPRTNKSAWNVAIHIGRRPHAHKKRRSDRWRSSFGSASLALSFFSIFSASIISLATITSPSSWTKRALTCTVKSTWVEAPFQVSTLIAAVIAFAA